ncbi:hypothetical protein BDV12DRAFT_204937 [Aspergillus spectabilis]
MSPSLYVVFYRPRYGNYQHWALQLESDKSSLIFEVVGQHPNFERNVLYVEPERSGSFIRKLYVGVLSDSDIQRVKDAAKSVPVDNETSEWDCQDYVLEILDRLEEDYVLEEDDEDYQAARKELKSKRGAII